jgi:hypothetical protein
MNHDEMLETVRRNLQGAQHISRIRRTRHFRVRLLDRADRRQLSLGEFGPTYHRMVRPLLEGASRCWLDERWLVRMREVPADGRLTPGDTVPTRAWVDQWIKPVPGGTELRLEAALLGATAFWWWLIVAGLGFPPVLFRSIQSLDWPAFARGVYDPYYLGGGERDRRWDTAREHARAGTSRTDQVAFIPARDLDLEVTANARHTEALYRTAVNEASLSEGLWAHPA